MARVATIAICILCLAASVPVAAENSDERWNTVHWCFGDAIDLPMPLSISQSGYPDIDMTGHYKTKGFDEALYYSFRYSRWHNDHAGEFELIHHKAYLTNPPPEVDRFVVSHGYNLFMVNRAHKKDNGLIYRLGAGVVIGHPETVVRGKYRPEKGGILLNQGYYLGGVALQFAVEKDFELSSRWYAVLEAKATAAWARMPIAGGHADVPNVAFHLMGGLGYTF